MTAIPRNREIALLDAPSNLGLRPPRQGSVPGCYKAPWALRDCAILRRLHAVDAGSVVPPRYVADWTPGAGVRNGPAITDYTRKLAGRIASVVESGKFPLVLGGDCSILLGAALALTRMGRYGLAFLDAHADFRHLGNAPHVGAAAGEELALVTGRGDPALTDIDGHHPYVKDEDAIVIGARDPDDLLDIADSEITLVPGTGESVQSVAAARTTLVRDDLDGFWIHLDADVLDPSFLPAVDSPTPGGLDPRQLIDLLSGLLALPGAVGMHVTIFDPDLDDNGSQAQLLIGIITAALIG